MNYTLNDITTIADCDALLDIAGLQRGDLDLKKLQQARQYRLAITGSSGVDAELSGVGSEITGLESAVAGLPGGPAKQTLEDKLVELRHKQFLLEKRRRRYGTLALLQKQFAISRVEKELEEAIAYMDALTQRKAVLATA